MGTVCGWCSVLQFENDVLEMLQINPLWLSFFPVPAADNKYLDILYSCSVVEIFLTVSTYTSVVTKK